MSWIDTVKSFVDFSGGNAPVNGGRAIEESKVDTSSPMISNPYEDDGPYAEKRAEIRGKHKSVYRWLFEPSRGVRWDFDPLLLRDLTQGNTWVSMLVESITKEIAKAPWKIVEDENTEIQKRASKNPFERKQGTPAGEEAEELRELLRNPHPDHDWTDIVHMTMGDLLEVGSMALPKDFPEEAYQRGENYPIYNENSGFKPKNLKPSDPITFTKEFRKKTGIISGFWQYELKSSGGKGRRGVADPIHYKNEEIIWDDINPRSNRRYGLPPALAVMDILELMDLTISQEKHYFSRGSTPSGMIVFEELDREELEDYKQMIESDVKGEPHKMLTVGGAGGPVDFKPFSFNFQELQFLEREKWYAKIIASAFQVPVSVVGLKPEKVNYSTFQGERGNFEANTLGPYMQLLERVINKQLVWPHFSKNLRFELEPGMSEERRSKISERVRANYNADIITRNQALRQMGHEEVEDGDKIKSKIVPEAEGGQGGGEQGTGSPLAQLMSKGAKPLRENEDWHLFTYQPEDVKNLKGKISGAVGDLWKEILEDERIDEVIEAHATEEKSLGSISRKLKQIMTASEIVGKIKDVVSEETGEMVTETVEDSVEDTGLGFDRDGIAERVQNRPMKFADDYAERMEGEIRDTVGEGWSEGEPINEIKNDLQDKAEEFSDYQAERIARDQMQRATGEARNEFAKQHSDKFVEVWMTAEDDRVRDAHKNMNDTWKRPHEVWQVDYDGNVVEEDFPGDSKRGIQCRCDTRLVPEEEMDKMDHRGELN